MAVINVDINYYPPFLLNGGKETGHILNIKYSEKYRFEKKLWDRYKRPEEKGQYGFGVGPRYLIDTISKRIK
jgi:hypothetical protein